jgi:site-specific recombinase XerC
MDDARDREHSRAPELEDLLALCQALDREGVRYVLIGGFAVILHGYVRSTKDIDLLVDPSEENVRALKRALADLPDNAAAEMGDGDVRKYTVVRVADEVVVDVMASACGVRFEDLAAGGIERIDVEGTAIPVATKENLIRTKQTIRDSDAADVRFLRLRIAAERDR